MKLILPIPPSINHCYFYRNGAKIKNKTARDFEVIAEAETIKQMKLQKVEMFPEKTKIICEMTYFFKDNRRADTHNTLKLTLDSVERAGLYKDDRYVLPQILDFSVDREYPRVELYFKIKD